MNLMSRTETLLQGPCIIWKIPCMVVVPARCVLQKAASTYNSEPMSWSHKEQDPQPIIEPVFPITPERKSSFESQESTLLTP